MFFLSSYMWPKVVKQYIFFSIFCSMCVQIFSWQCLLLPVLPSYSKYGAESEISERSAAIPHQKDRLWSRHEDQMHQRWGGGVTQANSVPQLVWLTLPLTSISRAVFFFFISLFNYTFYDWSTGLSIHTFHGNFFVRSTDLLSLANVNPDSGFAVQMSIEESLADTSLACFQAALLYTSSKGNQVFCTFMLIHIWRCQTTPTN